MIGPGSCHSYMQVLRRRPALARLHVGREHAEALLAHLPDDHLFRERDDGRVGGRRRGGGLRRGALQLGARALPGAGGRRRGAVGGRQGRHVVVVAVNNEVLLLTFWLCVDGVPSVCKSLANRGPAQFWAARRTAARARDCHSTVRVTSCAAWGSVAATPAPTAVAPAPRLCRQGRRRSRRPHPRS